MQFYAYLWLRVDGTPYYAGKGKGRRAFMRGSHHLRPPMDRTRILIFVRSSEAAALSTERELIANWGRKDLGTGCLRNFTDGGEGSSGYRHTEDAKQKIQIASRSMSPETKEKIRKSLVGNCRNKGQHWILSAETKKNMSQAMQGVSHPRMRGQVHSVETRAKQSAAIKAWHKRQGHNVTA